MKKRERKSDPDPERSVDPGSQKNVIVILWFHVP
jgi:hypothetical protein